MKVSFQIRLEIYHWQLGFVSEKPTIYFLIILQWNMYIMLTMFILILDYHLSIQYMNHSYGEIIIIFLFFKITYSYSKYLYSLCLFKKHTEKSIYALFYCLVYNELLVCIFNLLFVNISRVKWSCHWSKILLPDCWNMLFVVTYVFQTIQGKITKL